MQSAARRPAVALVRRSSHLASPAVRRAQPPIATSQPSRASRRPFATSRPAANELVFPLVPAASGSSPFQHVQAGPNRTAMPSFASLEAERTYRKEHLALAFRILHRFGMAEGIAGHCSVRDPVDPNSFWVNPQSKSFALMKASNLVRCSVDDGTILEGAFPVDASATAIHSQIYKGRGRGPAADGGSPGGVEALVHVHGPYTKAFSSLGRELDMISQDACAYYQDQVLIPFGGAVFDNSEGSRIASFVGPDKKVAILQNHGIVSLGRLSIDEAAWWQINFEMCCKAQLLADAALRRGEAFTTAGEAEILSTKAEMGSAEMGWFSLAAYVEEEEAHSQGAHRL